MVNGAVWGVHRVPRGPGEGAPHPGREILWRRTSKLMPGGHTGFNKERPRRGNSRQRKLRGRGPEARGSWSIPLRMAGGEAPVGRGQEVKMRKQKRPFRRPINTG